MKKIGFIGLGKLGQPVTDVIRDKYDVKTFDINNTGNSTFEQCVIDQDIVFVAVPTNHNEGYDGQYVCSDLEPKDFNYDIVESVLKKINTLSTNNIIVTLISTVLPGTTRRRFDNLITKGTLLYNPYLIAMGSVKHDFMNPEMIMIGGNNTSAILNLRKFYDIF